MAEGWKFYCHLSVERVLKFYETVFFSGNTEPFLMTSKKNRIILVTAFLLLFSTLIILTISLSIVFYLYMSSSNDDEEVHEYQMTEINPFSETTQYGFVTLPETLGREDHYSYVNEETGSNILITNLGGSEFECTGTCYCSTLASRRVTGTGNLLGRSFMIILTAFSTSMALQLAKETFDNQCIQKFSDSCEETFILSEADDCVEKEDEEPEVEVSDPDFDQVPVDPDEDPHTEHYLCRGTCVLMAENDRIFSNTFPYILRDEYLEVGKKEIGDCSNLHLEHIVRVTKELRESYRSGALTSTFSDQNIAAASFARGTLNEFCEANSLLESDLFSVDSNHAVEKYVRAARIPHEDNAFSKYPDLLKKLERWVYKRPFCFGYNLEGDNPQYGYEMNFDNSNCLRIDN